ncbi:uncharacterized protein A4U43_C04F32840 [Asparagus officinalis]|uniref:Integrase catalytic domain-containing protein n=1 Tax=Asparagus officinalis TaxID=4686 RepID=A0A5P1F5A3_ASPOF|nr:uncharacterized protein A4U43_C04F32840 [Asparagus officinalis]
MSSVCKAPKNDVNEQEAHIVQDALILAMDNDIHSWVIDSGALFYTTASRKFFQNYIAGDFGKVYLGDNEPCSVVERDDVDSWKISNDTMMVDHDNKIITLYLTSHASDTLTITTSKESAALWHNRLGHMSENGMTILHSQEKLSGIDSVKVDIWGPASVSSLGYSAYYVTFIDDHSRKVWVYFMKHKLEVFGIFKKWKAMVKNEIDMKVKCLRSNNNGEYEPEEFKKFYALNEICLERTTPGTP